MQKKYNMLLTGMFLAGLVLPGCTAGSGDSISTRVASLPAVESEEKEGTEMFRYVSRDYFYTDFEGESVLQTDVEDANMICQRDLRGGLTDSYQMGENFWRIFYVDENWLYYSELTDPADLDSDAESLYRVPLSHKDGREIPDFSGKEYLFTEPAGLSQSDFTENSFLQWDGDTLYYCAGDGLGTYNIRSGEQKRYLVRDREKESINAAGTGYMIAEGEKQCDVLTDLKTGKSKVLETDRHPWLRLGRKYYFRFPYTPFGAGDILLDLNSGETMEVISKEEGERVAEEAGVPWDKDWLEPGGWDGMDIRYIGWHNQRVYAEIRYPSAVKDKKGKKVSFWDSVCASRNMDEESGWTVEKEITDHARKEIKKYYKQVEEGSYKIEKDEDGEILEVEVDIGEGIANGIFYFSGLYKKKGRMAKDIYDLEKRELRVIGRNSPESFYPFYDNSHRMWYNMHGWQEIRTLAPIMGRTEDLWEQEQKRKIP